MSDHAWVQENLDAYLAGGLPLEEGDRLEAHVAGCDACVSALAAAQKLDRTLVSLFAPVRPDAALEDRAIQKLRSARPRRRSMALRFVGAAAAIVVMGGLGVVVQALAAEGGLPFPGVERRSFADLSDSLARFDTAWLTGTNQNASDPLVRMEQMLIDSENERQSKDKIRRFWTNDQPSFLTPYKITGGLQANPKALDDAKFNETVEIRGLHDLDGSLAGVPSNSLGDKGKEWAESERLGRNLGESEGRKAKESERRPAMPTAPAGSSPGFSNAITGNGSTVPSLSLPVPAPVANPSTDWAGNDVNVLGGAKPTLGYYKPGDGSLIAKQDNRDSFLVPNPDVTDQALLAIPIPALNQNEVASKMKFADPAAQPVERILKSTVLAQAPKQPDPPPDPARKIIRTGELEFEIDSFDNSVAAVATLINAVKGGFVATVNSDKLPNGKVRGSVVVRMPPQFLDKFLLDLRKELGKVGELKTQRIGSQDVTKQYTDIESRLRAARTMEERFIAIIKNGKGEVKDLIAAERELGIWRTKIEEMEGEIRYFNNQVGLSTLTISLTEKEIQAAAAVVITERVGMRIEVEDVEKAHIDALKAVAEEKGRITKSELKQHPAGQLEAVLQVEVAPEKAKKLRDIFKKLGLVTFNDVQRVQQAVGGGKVGEFEGKLKQADVQIHVTLYDTANIQPRESVTMLIATDDVQASYRALQAAVVKAKGQIRVGQLREPEKLTINAEFNFDVPSPEKPTIDAILAKLGVILSSTDVQVPINETATDRKFGYRLVLRNLATVPARETSILRIAVNDVPTVFRELQDAVLAAKGVIHVQQLNVASKISVDAVLSFDVPKADRQAFDKVLAKLGMVLSSTSTKAQANEITTDRKFGYKLDLINLDSVRPKEIFTIELVTNDVRANFQELRDAVAQAKGLLYLDRLIEDTPQQTQGKLDFDVASADKAAIEKLLAKSGAVLKRSSNQANVNETASDRKVGYRILLHSIASVPPREKVTLVIKVDDVNARAAELAKQVRDAKGQSSRPRITQSAREMNASLVFDVPLLSEDMILRSCKDAGRVLDESQTQNLQVPDNDLATAQISVTLSGPRQIIASDESFWTPIQRSLEITFQAFAWSVTVVILGLGVVLPWVIAIWVCVKIVRKMRGSVTSQAS